MDVTTLVEKYFSVEGSELCFGGVRVSTVADRFGTPVFIYDAGVLERKFNLLRATLPPEFTIYYSVKANPTQALLRFFLSKGCGLEIASAGEFHQARSAGCAAERILFAGPGKTEAELQEVVAQGIGEIHAESQLELQRISRISRRLMRRAKVALRINPNTDAQGGAMRMGGKPAPFGMDEETLDSVLPAVMAEPTIELTGIHLFVGTQILDFTILLQQYQHGLKIAGRVADFLRHPLHTVDFGGGLGIPYFSNEQELDTDKLRRGLESMMQEVRSVASFEGTRFVIEPGRYLVGEGGVYVTQVSDIKSSRGKKFLIVDGGMNHHLAASGNLGQTIKRNYPVAILNRIDLAAKETVDIVGPLCTPLDVLARAVEMPRAEVGDLIGVFQSGAYARSASPLSFLSHATPAEVLVDKGEAQLIRCRGAPDECLQNQPKYMDAGTALRSRKISQA